MPIYECKECNYQTKIKTHYIRHLNTKKHQNNIKGLIPKAVQMLE